MRKIVETVYFHDLHLVIQVKRLASIVRMYVPEHSVDLNPNLAKYLVIYRLRRTGRGLGGWA